MLYPITRPAAWAALAVVILVALFPSGTFLALPSGFADRALRYGVLAFLLVTAYPRSVLATTILIAICSLALEALQLLNPAKSMNLAHLVPNIGGASLGITAAILVLYGLEALPRPWAK